MAPYVVQLTDKEQEHLKIEYDVDKVYAPDNLDIKKNSNQIKMIVDIIKT